MKLIQFIPNRAFFETIFSEWDMKKDRPPHIDSPKTYNNISKDNRNWEEFYRSNKQIEFMGLVSQDGEKTYGYISYIKLRNPSIHLLRETFYSDFYYHMERPIQAILIEGILIKKEYRGQGLGKLMLRNLHATLDELNLPYIIELNSSNPSAKLYGQLGYIAAYAKPTNNGDSITVYYKPATQPAVSV